MSNRLTLEQCGEQGRFRGLPGGEYRVEYHDTTHLQPGKWLRLARVTLHEGSIPLGEEGSEQFFTILKDIEDLPEDAAEKGNKSPDDKELAKRQRTIEDTLALALGRAGLLSPELTDELFDELLRLGREDGVVIVPDTNALHNGAVHWLLRVLRKPSVWLLPLAASLTTVQSRDATVKGLLSKTKSSNVKQALRSRGLVNGALGLLRRNRGRSQVVEIDHSLLRYQKTASSTGADPDQGDILEDRLIIEAIHNVLRTMRSRTARRVVTSDVNLARVLYAEGIETLFVPTIAIAGDAIDCLRFDALAGGFIGAPLRSVLWELTHAFGSVRLTSDAGVAIALECYWPGKTPREWETETLNCSFIIPASGMPAPFDTKTEAAEDTKAGTDTAGSPPSESTERNGKAREGDGVGQPSKPKLEGLGERRSEGTPPAKAPARAKAKAAKLTAQTATTLPRASLPQAFRVLGLIRHDGPLTAQQVASRLSDRTTPDTVRRTFNLLTKLRLLTDDGGSFHATADADIADSLLRTSDLDGLSSLLERFEPYRFFRDQLRDRGVIARKEAVPIIQSAFNNAGSYEAERLPRYLVLAGQAWTDGDDFRDGSSRLTDRDATEMFDVAFAETAADGLSKVVNLLPHFCRLTKMSPWAAKRQIGRLAANRLLPRYSFEPSAGGKPVTRDEVLAGSLESIVAEPVVIDRFHLGERPVFTVGGPAQ